MRDYHGTPRSVQSRLNSVGEVPDFTHSLPGKHNCESTSITDMELKVMNDRVKCCVEDTGSTDEPTAKYRWLKAPTHQKSVHRLASTLRSTVLLVICTTLAWRLNQSQVFNRAICIMQRVWRKNMW